MSDCRKVEWRKIRACIRRQFREPMKDEKRKAKDRERKVIEQARKQVYESSILYPNPREWKM
jgi:hypothetical protein